MQFYYVIMFVHISSALALFMGWAIEWVGITRLQYAVTKEQIDEWSKFLSSQKYIFISAGIILLITGMYMASTKLGWTPWIIVSLLLWLFVIFYGSLVTGKKIAKLGKLLHSDSVTTMAELQEQLNKLRLMNFLQSELAVGLGTIFIMTVKPDMVGSIGVVIVAIILGIIPLLSKRKAVSAGLDKA